MPKTIKYSQTNRQSVRNLHGWKIIPYKLLYNFVHSSKASEKHNCWAEDRMYRIVT